jgi:ASC-1-like (ASCH) protein
MKIQPEYYNYIVNGTKRIEIRINDLKRRQLKLGDRITFINASNLEENIIVEVKGLLYYKNFNDLVNDYDIDILASKDITKEEMLNVLLKFYPIEEQEKYNVVGIRFELISR